MNLKPKSVHSWPILKALTSADTKKKKKSVKKFWCENIARRVSVNIWFDCRHMQSKTYSSNMCWGLRVDLTDLRRKTYKCCAKRQKLARKLSGKKELKRASIYICIVQMLWQYIMTLWIVWGRVEVLSFTQRIEKFKMPNDKSITRKTFAWRFCGIAPLSLSLFLRIRFCYALLGFCCYHFTQCRKRY